jgi:hypothetical protein
MELGHKWLHTKEQTIMVQAVTICKLWITFTRAVTTIVLAHDKVFGLEGAALTNALSIRRTVVL